jgi:uncharacterized protein
MVQPRNIANSFGVNVCGSAYQRTEPDHVFVYFSVFRTGKTPNEAFKEVKLFSSQVQNYLNKSHISECGSSQINLSEDTEWVNGRHRLIGYSATVKFNLVLRELDRLEEILSGIITSGASKINSITFGTSQIEQIQEQIRIRAINDAKSKAMIFCKAAGISLGKVIYLEDLEKPVIQGNVHYGAVTMGGDTQEEPIGDTSRAFNPASILLQASVMLTFEIL